MSRKMLAFPTYDGWALELVHIVPVDDQGEVAEGHELTAHCACKPVVDDYDTMFPPVVIHNYEIEVEG